MMVQAWHKVDFGAGKVTFLDDTRKEDMLRVEYPNDYFESLHYDFISRCDGDEWPE